MCDPKSPNTALSRSNSPDPLDKDQLRSAIKDCAAEIVHLTMRKHHLVPDVLRLKKHYEKQLRDLKRGFTLGYRQVSDAEWRRMAEERKETEG